MMFQKIRRRATEIIITIIEIMIILSVEYPAKYCPIFISGSFMYGIYITSAFYSYTVSPVNNLHLLYNDSIFLSGFELAYRFGLFHISISLLVMCLLP